MAVCSTSAPRRTPLPSPRLGSRPRLHWRAPWPWLLAPSPPLPYPVDACAALTGVAVSARQGVSSVPSLRFARPGGPHASPGCAGVSRSRLETRSALIRACGPSPLLRVGDSPLTTLPPGVHPSRIRLPRCEAGFPVGFRVTALDSRFSHGWSVAPEGRLRSARHLGGRHVPCPERPVSPIHRAQPPLVRGLRRPQFQSNGSPLHWVVRRA